MRRKETNHKPVWRPLAILWKSIIKKNPCAEATIKKFKAFGQFRGACKLQVAPGAHRTWSRSWRKRPISCLLPVCDSAGPSGNIFCLKHAQVAGCKAARCTGDATLAGRLIECYKWRQASYTLVVRLSGITWIVSRKRFTIHLVTTWMA